MLALLRTYRFLTALVAVVLLLSGTLPLIQHACAMMQHGTGTAAMHAHCPHHEAAPSCHDAQDAAGKTMIRHQYDATASKTCCTVEAAPVPGRAHPLLTEPAPRIVLQPAALLLSTLLHPGTPAQPSPLLADACDTGPSSAVALHVLNGSFLL